MPRGIAGVILAGGRSQRMGSDKSLTMLAGQPIVAHVAARLAPQAERAAVNANGDARRFGFLGLPIVADTIAGFAGPLAGILAGLRWAHREGFGRLATVATDTPFFPGDLVRRLAEAAVEPGAIAVARCDGRIHPVFALWPTGIADDVEAFLASGRKASVLALIEGRRHTFVDFEPLTLPRGPLDPFFNINTPTDLEAAERIATELQS